MKRSPVLGDGHWIRKKGGGWLITVPPEVRQRLGVRNRMRLYWIISRRGEVYLSAKTLRDSGRAPTAQLMRDLAAAQRELAHIRVRDALRDRGMYAEGFAHGYVQAYERLSSPDGPSAERGRRRSMYRWAYPDAGYLTDPKQLAPRPAPARPRPNARTRRAKRDGGVGPGVEVVPGPDTMPSPQPSPEVAFSEGEALAPGPSVPGQPIEVH